MSAHSTSRRVHMGHGAARSAGAWRLLCTSPRGGGNAKPLLIKLCRPSSADDAVAMRTARHIEQPETVWEQNAAFHPKLGGGEEGGGRPGWPETVLPWGWLRDRKSRSSRSQAAVAGSSGCPAAGRGRQTPRRRGGGCSGTAPPARDQRLEGTGGHGDMGTKPAEPGWHSVPHGPGAAQPRLSSEL